MKTFVTGADGFVGRWLVRHLETCGDEVIAGVESNGFDLLNSHKVHEQIVAAQPDVIYHLAAQSLVNQSWKDPVGTFEVNATGTLHLLDAALTCSQPPTVLLASSADVYGTVPEELMPIAESQPLAPVSPFAVSKVAAEYLGMQAYLGTKLKVITARGFNYIGPDQPPHFVAPALALRIIAAGRTAATQLPIGNLDSQRDYIDVRDAVRAYRLLVEKGKAGEIYNVCSAKVVSIRSMAELLLDAARINLDLVVDPKLVRSREVSVVRGDCARLKEATNWRPEIKLEQSLREILRHYRNEI